MRRVRSLVIIGILLGGGLTASDPADGAAGSSPHAVSDAEIVSALAYGAGDLAGRLGTEVGRDLLVSQSFDVERYRTTSRQASVELLTAEKQRLRPVLRGLRSGDPYRVHESFSSLREIVVEHTRRQMKAEGSDPADREAMNTSGRCGFAVVCVAYAALGVHNAAVLTAAAAVVVSAALWCGAWTWCGKAGSQAENAAAQERLARNIASTIRS